MIEFVKDKQIYDRVICDRVPMAKRFLWIATADMKDLHVDKRGKMVPFLEILSGLIHKNIEIRLLHAKEPGPAFKEDFDRYPNLIGGMERILCPRVHLKTIVVDGDFAFVGSANLTGAGVGAKSPNRRNFESGIITTDKKLIAQIMEHTDSIWRGDHCKSCGRKAFCSDFKDLLGK